MNDPVEAMFAELLEHARVVGMIAERVAEVRIEYRAAPGVRRREIRTEVHRCLDEVIVRFDALIVLRHTIRPGVPHARRLSDQGRAVQLRREGKSMASIAATLHVSLSTVWRMLDDAGVTKRFRS